VLLGIQLQWLKIITEEQPEITNPTTKTKPFIMHNTGSADYIYLKHYLNLLLSKF